MLNPLIWHWKNLPWHLKPTGQSLWPPPPTPDSSKPFLTATSLPPPAVQLYEHPFSPTDTYLFPNDWVFGYRTYQRRYWEIIPDYTTMFPPLPFPVLTPLSKIIKMKRRAFFRLDHFVLLHPHFPVQHCHGVCVSRCCMSGKQMEQE